MDIQANEFDHAVDGWVRAAIIRGARSFPELVRLLPGVYPGEALRSVARLRQELPPAWELSGTPSVIPATDSWPIVEHPLDFDWRFTPEAVRVLLDRCHGPAPKSVAFLGAPTLAREATSSGWRDGVFLYDQNPTVVAAIEASLPTVTAACIDLVRGDPVDAGDIAVAVADPPWYPEHFAAFLWAASRLTRLGGRVLISLPQEGTRPGIPHERKAIFAWATTIGLQPVSIDRGALAYRTPPFERNALAAAGAPEVPWDWRRGDLAEFVAVAKTQVDRPIPPWPPDLWDEESVGVVRIKCRMCADNKFRDPTLLSAVPGDILGTVSRRDPARAVADVWTSGNRVFRCAGTGVFRAIVAALRRGGDVESAVAAAIGRKLSAEETTLVQQAASQAFDLVRREEWELAKDAHQRHGHDDLAGTV